MDVLGIIFWLAIIIFSVLRGMQANQKAQNPNDPSPDAPPTDPLQEAIREIEAALRGEAPQREPTQDSRSTFQEVTVPQEKVKERVEPEFHSMESEFSKRNLEKETSFKEFYSDKTLESQFTYEDSFPESAFFDDAFSHAHPDSEVQTSNPNKKQQKRAIKDRLRNKQDLADAVILQTILNRRPFPPGIR